MLAILWKVLQILQKNTTIGVSFLIKFQPFLFKKETPTQLFSFEF